MSHEQFVTEHRPDESRYVLFDQGETAGDTNASSPREIGEASYAVYTPEGADAAQQRIFYHTLVQPAYGGRGLASQLVRAALDDSIAAGAQIVPVCSYVVRWVEKHDDYASHVVKATPQHLAALSNRH